MNNLYKLLAFICLVFVTSAVNAQTVSGTVQATGLIQVNENLPWQDEYVFNTSHLNFSNYTEAANFFQKYVSTFTTYGQFTFDIANQKMYMKIQRENSVHIGNLTPKSLNSALQIIHSR